MIGVLPRGRGRPRNATYPKSTLLPAVSRGDAACPPTHGPLPRAAKAGGVATGSRSFMRSGMEAMISSRRRGSVEVAGQRRRVRFGRTARARGGGRGEGGGVGAWAAAAQWVKAAAAAAVDE